MMGLQVIPKEETAPAYDKQAIKLQHIAYFDAPYAEYEGKDITEDVIAKVLRQIPEGINIYLSLIPYGEDNWLEVNCDGQWLALGYSSHSGQDIYYSYNPLYADTVDRISQGDFDDDTVYSPLESGGQSPIPNIQAITNIEIGVQAVEYFIRTGKLYPKMDWLHEF